MSFYYGNSLGRARHEPPAVTRKSLRLASMRDAMRVACLRRAIKVGPRSFIFTLPGWGPTCATF